MLRIGSGCHDARTLPPMPYRTILFDLDHTLLDSDASSEHAFRAALAHAGITVDGRHVDRFAEINLGLWDRVEAGELSPNDVRTIRFERLFSTMDIAADPTSVGDEYVRCLGAFGDLYPGTTDALDRLTRHATLGIVTNGIGDVQRARIGRLRLDRWFDAFVISGEVGIAKPDPAIFDLAFAELGEPARSTALMVGDSLTSDMAGGTAAGIDTAWLNAARLSPNGVPITHHISHIRDLIPLTTNP